MAIAAPTMGTTTFSGFWEMTGDAAQYTPISRTQEGWRAPAERQIAQLATKKGMYELTAIMKSILANYATGSNASATFTRRKNPDGPSASTPVVTGITDLGGLIDMETATIINRNTTHADADYLKAIFDGTLTPHSLTFAVDLSGNGSGFGGKNSMVGW